LPSFLLLTGSAFKSVGLADDAVFAFLKAGDVALAVEACLSLHHWSLAVEIAQSYNQPQINPLLTKAAEQLLGLNKLTTAIELYKRAGMHPEAARLLEKLGQEQAATKAHPLRAKQLFVLAASEVEMFRIKSFAVEHNTTATQLGTMAVGTMATMSTMGGGRAGSTVATVQTLSALMDADSQAFRHPPPSSPLLSHPPSSLRPRTTKS
jgi:WD repeat-containing protein 35